MARPFRLLIRILPFIGVLLILLGNALSVYHGGFTTPTMVMLVVGLVLFLLIFVRFESQNLKNYLNLAFYSFFVLGIIVFIYLMVNNHNQILDLTKAGLFSLSPQTQKFLQSMEQEVELVAFTEDPQRFRDFLKRYRYVTRKVKYKIYNPYKDHLLARQYADNIMPGDVFVVSQNRKKRVQQLEESAITNAIVEVTREQDVVAYFLGGHGERSLEEQLRSPTQRGISISQLKQLLEDRAIKVNQLELFRKGFVPEDCSLLFCIGPVQDLYPTEAETIEQYLNQGGKAMFLLDPIISSYASFDNFINLLKKFGMVIKDDIIIDVNPLSQAISGDYLTPIITFTGQHEIVQTLPTSVAFPASRVRTIARAQPLPSGLKIDTLLESSEFSWSEMLEKIRQDPKVEMAGESQRKPQPVGVAVSRPLQAEPGIPAQKEMRLLVVGDSDFLLDAYISQTTATFFVNSLNWLLEMKELLDIPPKLVDTSPLFLSRGQIRLLFLLLTFSLPSLIFFGGLGYTILRRRTK